MDSKLFTESLFLQVASVATLPNWCFVCLLSEISSQKHNKFAKIRFLCFAVGSVFSTPKYDLFTLFVREAQLPFCVIKVFIFIFF